MNEIILRNKKKITSLEIAELIGMKHKNVLRDIKDEIQKLGIERGQLIFEPTEYTDNFNRKQPMFLLNIQGVLQLGARYSAETRFKLVEKFVESETPKINSINEKELKIKESELFLKYANSFTNEKYRETMLVLGANKLNGSEVLPLPEIKRKSYTASELSQIIMNDFGIKISSKRIGIIANENNLKTTEYGYWAFDKSRYSNKQVETFRYYDTVIDEIRKIVN